MHPINISCSPTSSNSLEVQLWWIGKTAFPYLREGIEDYRKRIQHLLRFKITELDSVKSIKDENQQLLEEENRWMKLIRDEDYIILCDERGKMYSSPEFAEFLDQQLTVQRGRMVFIIGGAYGFSENLRKRAQASISFSKFTFSHQLFRLIFMEQLYRWCTIIKRIPYHHE